MMWIKRIAALAAAGLLLVSTAFSEVGVIKTPGGQLKVRKKPSGKAGVMMTVPNGSTVTVLESDDEWTKITYRKKEGYIRTEFILLSSAMIGKTLYIQQASACLYEQTDSASALVGVVSAVTPVQVLRVEDDWCYVQSGEWEGYLMSETLVHQKEQPSAQPDWVARQGLAVKQLSLTAEDGKTEIAAMPKGTEVIVTLSNKGRCLVCAGDVWGWTDQSGIRLVASDQVQPAEDKAILSAADKLLRGAKNKNLMPVIDPSAADVPQGWQLLQLVNTDICPKYTALINDAGKVVWSSDDTGYSDEDLRAAKNNRPVGQLEVTASADQVSLGGVITFQLGAWAGASFHCELLLDDAVVAKADNEGETAAFRPRQAGEYLLKVRAADTAGVKAEQEVTFTASGSLSEHMQEHVYSQKDGWWLNRQYQRSNLQKSGCAIFALSHALERMGYTGQQILPEVLAKTYSGCLTVDGTANNRLIRRAAEDFGFKTREDLYMTAGELEKLLRQGCMFSFSVARGHIALIDGISNDGNMVHVVDSAPSATFERISENYGLYYQHSLGGFIKVRSLDELPGACWYLQTGEYGGLEYWMPIKYAALRGGRLIQPAGE